VAGRARRALASGLGLVVLAACSSGSGGAGPAPATATTATSTSAVAAASAGTYGPPRRIGTVEDSGVTESSGLVASRRNPGRYWTHNDSGDGPFLYCVGSRGERCGVWRVAGAQARDWEDIAAGPGPDPSTPYLYVGDIGDNLEDQTTHVVYRVPEPAVTPGTVPTKASPGVTERAEALTLRYPDGSHNAEALLVQPQTGDLYIVVKEPNPTVYVARAPIAAAGTTTLQAVATLPLPGGGLGVVTGGDISPDGQRVALCTYLSGYEFRLPAGTTAFDAIWQQRAEELDVGARAQGEAIAYRLDGKALLTTSEGESSPLWQAEQN